MKHPANLLTPGFTIPSLSPSQVSKFQAVDKSWTVV